MNTCKECRWWKEEPKEPRGLCISDKFVSVNYSADSYPPDTLVYSDGFDTGPNFGCIHWEELSDRKDSDEQT